MLSVTRKLIRRTIVFGRKKKLKKIPSDLVSYIQIETESIRDQLMECHKAIMAVKIVRPSERPIIDIKYPEGYEG